MTHKNNDSRIPLYRWVMHGAVMLGRAFCYAMETALVTPVLLQIGLPEQYYSLTWFPSSILGLILSPVIGSLSDRCTLRLGRRRPFILALCVGVLLGVALFLNGSLIGLSIGDSPGSQPIGIVLTVLGVVVLDFCADATEGPIRSYLLDVANTEEQDMALNIHSFAAGIGGAVGYMLAGLDWTDTALGRAFKYQEQILFLFTAIIFIIAVILHMFSIPERPFKSSHQAKAIVDGDPCNQSSLQPNGPDPTGEEDAFIHEENPVALVLEMDVPDVECVMSNSDSALDRPETAKQLDPDDLDLNSDNPLLEAHFLPAESQHEMEEAFSSTNHVNYASSPTLSPPVPPPPPCEMSPPTGEMVEFQPTILLKPPQMDGQTDDHFDSTDILALSHPQMDNRQLSFIPPISGRVVSQVYHLRKPASEAPQAIPSSRSLNDPCEIQQNAERRCLSSEASDLEGGPEGGTTVRLLWLSMFKMPSQLWRLCVCHLITWFSVLAEGLFYTDFMGQVIYHGDPTAPANSVDLQNYHKGVQMGCWGLAVYAASAAVSSALLQKYLDNFHLSIKVIYMLGTLGFSIGTAVMAIFPNVYIAMAMISSMGVMDMTISYCPYALLSQYHEIKEFIQHSPENSKRGFGIDCAILSCQVYVSQILVASALSAVVDAVGSVRVIPVVASVSSFLGFLTACFLVIYPNRQRSSEHTV